MNSPITKDTTPATATKTVDSASLAQSIVQVALGLKEGTEIPEYFKVGGQYAQDQFTIGWTARSLIAGRISGEQASFLTHPDAGIDYEKLPAGVKKFIEFFSTFQVAIFGKLNVNELLELQAAGTKYTSALTSESSSTTPPPVLVEEPLLGKVNVLHHKLWMAARDLASVLDPEITIRDHDAHKAHNLMTPKEIAADNAAVQGYALILSQMPKDAFDWLLGKCVA